MICFPLDNTSYQANALGAWLCSRTRGVFSADYNLMVSSNDDMTVTVTPGLGWVKVSDYWGAVILQDTSVTLTHDTADSSLNRIDAICVRIDKNNNGPEMVIKKGNPATTPAIPAIVRDVNYDELYLATVYIAAGTTAIAASNVTDQRLNETYCGLMRDGVSAIPSQALLDQLNATFNAWFESVQDALDGDTAGNLLTMIQANSEAITNVSGVASSAVTAAATAQSTANSAASTANAAMPRAGGAFTGAVTDANADRTGYYIRGDSIQNSSGTNIGSSRKISRRK